MSRRIDAYPDVNKLYGERHGQQNGDPEKGIQRVYELITLTGMCADKSWAGRLRLIIGSDSYAGAKAKAETFAEDVEACKDIAHTTDIPGVASLSTYA